MHLAVLNRCGQEKSASRNLQTEICSSHVRSLAALMNYSITFSPAAQGITFLFQYILLEDRNRFAVLIFLSRFIYEKSTESAGTMI